MILGFEINDEKNFTIEHLFNSPDNEQLIQNFKVDKQSAKGLELFLKFWAFPDEDEKSNRTYLIKDKTTGELAGYFSLRNGMITQQIENPAEDDIFNSIPAIELSNFAVNAEYKKNHKDITKLGAYIFTTFIRQITQKLSDYTGIQALYIYALPNERLIKYYKTLGFTRLLPEDEKYVHAHIKPKYDKECIFMYQTL